MAACFARPHRVVPVTSTPAVQITPAPSSSLLRTANSKSVTAQPAALPGKIFHTGAACGPLSAFSRCLKVARTPLTSGRVSTAGSSTALPLPLLPWAAGVAGASATPLLLLLPSGMGAQGRAACGTNHSDSLLMNCWGCFARMASQSTCRHSTAQHGHAGRRISTARGTATPIPRSSLPKAQQHRKKMRGKLFGRSMRNLNAALLHVRSPSLPTLTPQKHTVAVCAAVFTPTVCVASAFTQIMCVAQW